LGLIGLFVALGGWDSLRRLGHLRAQPTLLAAVATVVITGAASWRWGLLSNDLAGRTAASVREYFHYLMVSRVIGYVVPKDVSDVGSRVACLNRLHGVTMSHAVGSVVLDRLFDFATMGMILLGVLPFWLGWLPAQHALALAGGLYALGGIALGLFHAPLIAAPLWVVRKVGDVVRRWRGRGGKSKVVAHAVTARTALAGYGLSGIKFGATAVRMGLFAEALGLDLSLALLFLATPLGQLSYAMAFTPGGLGIFEAGWVGALRWAAVPMDTAVGLAIGQRVLTLAIIVGLASLSQAVFTLRRGHRTPSA
jgi:uncharacterized membrane protein YbhN (UPF0104 family)